MEWVFSKKGDEIKFLNGIDKFHDNKKAPNLIGAFVENTGVEPVTSTLPV